MTPSTKKPYLARMEALDALRALQRRSARVGSQAPAVAPTPCRVWHLTPTSPRQTPPGRSVAYGWVSRSTPARPVASSSATPDLDGMSMSGHEDQNGVGVDALTFLGHSDLAAPEPDDPGLGAEVDAVRDEMRREDLNLEA